MTPIYKAKLPKRALTPKQPMDKQNYSWSNQFFRHEHPDKRPNKVWCEMMEQKFSLIWRA